MLERNFAERPWTKTEQADYRFFLGEMERGISDPELARFLAPGPNGEFFDLVYEADGRTQRVCRWLLGRLRKLPAQLLRE